MEFRRRGSGSARIAALVLAAMTLVAMLSALVGCAGGGKDATAQHRASAPPTTTQGKLALRVRQSVGSAAKSVDLTYDQAKATANVTVTLIWSPTWKVHFSQAQAVAKAACFKTEAALWTSGVSLSTVTVTVLGQALDDYGEIITGAYAAVTLTSAHASAVSWTTSTPEAAWASYDDSFLRPLYGSDWMYPRPTTPPANQ
ncbi:MAG TPA: hypothetical protein VF792_01025 [Ktedonobacterales bacterium]